MPKGVYKHTKGMKTGKHMLGRKLSRLTKRKMSESQKRIGNKPPSSFGRKLSEETKRKISESNKKAYAEGRKSVRGDKNPAWKGGITLLVFRIRHCFRYRQWVSDIFSRDDFTCQECDKRGGYLEAHHFPKKFSDILEEYKIKTLQEALNCEELWSLNNGQTLCRKCHDKTKYQSRDNKTGRYKQDG